MYFVGNPNDRRKHELIHEKGRNAIYCTYCKKYFEDIKNHDDTAHSDFLFTCEICKRKFRSERDINRHKLMRHMDETYICDLCGNGYGDLYHLRCHIQTHIVQAPHDIKNIQDGNAKILDCSFCGKHFNYPRSVIRHILSVHEKVKDFECEICARKFSDKGELNKHKKKFHEEKNSGKFCKICKIKIEDIKEHYDQCHDDLEFICDVCHIRFRNISTLGYHKKLKHPEYGKDPKFLCKICGKGYIYKSQLLKHELIHQDTLEVNEKRHHVSIDDIDISVKQEPIESVETIINFDGEDDEFIEIKQEPIEEEYEVKII